MLYPVTDNYIDSNRPAAEKQAYNRLIHDKIAGLPVTPTDPHEELTCRLLSAVEETYPRSGSNDIYQGLLLILDAQQASVTYQQSSDTSLTMEQRLDISLYKGGVSVLIDRYLAENDNTEQDLEFYLGYGFILQLADDLQDITIDRDEGSQTLFTLCPTPAQTGLLVNRLLNFIDRLFASYKPVNTRFHEFVKNGCLLLIIMSAQMSREHFSPEYMAQLETYFPVSYAYLNRYLKDSSLYPGKIPEDELLRELDSFLASEQM